MSSPQRYRMTASTLLTATGGDPTIVQRDAHEPRGSPDGQFLAAHRRSGTSDEFAIFSMKDGSLIRKLPGAVANYEWDNTSTALICSRGAGNVDSLWRVALDGGPPTQMTQFTSDHIYTFSLSPDGRLAIARGETANDVVVLRQ